jgi:hypothetical protein
LKFNVTLGGFIAVIAVNQIFILTPAFSQNLYYFFFLLVFLISALYARGLRLNPLTFWLIMAGILSILVNQIPTFFQAPLRLLSFTIIIATIGPLFSFLKLDITKVAIFSKVNLILFFLAALSFTVYAFNLPIPQPRLFSGFLNHSMILGPVSGISILLGLYQLAFIQKKDKRKKWWLYTAIVLSFFCLILAASRAAIAGASAGVLFYFYKLYQRNFGRLLGTLIAIFLLGIISFPLWSDYTERIQIKQASAAREGDLASSRRSLWEGRYAEFQSSPVFGIGFATLDNTSEESNVREDTGGIEPGTSWLSVLSMVGIFGFIPFFLLFFGHFLHLLRDKKNREKSALLGGLLIFFATHMFAEGYIFASGGFLFFYVWLLLGIIEVYKRRPSLLKII